MHEKASSSREVLRAPGHSVGNRTATSGRAPWPGLSVPRAVGVGAGTQVPETVGVKGQAGASPAALAR